MNTMVEGMPSRVTKLEATNYALNKRLKELQDQIRHPGQAVQGRHGQDGLHD